ncbi:DUF732 domain-containing protein [Corynebacterium cystitidis]|uniref:DUF732 domain-containing protein n=1 Tax=Corynebacterium cystitidis TaxID=35757 RepID=UPI00211F1E7A|nr:DUF732 domain-containing protein [Corynebacterium cystitidis]
MRRLTLSAMTLAAALSLAACGGATVESEDVTSSLSPAPATVTTSATETTTEETTTTPVAPRPDQPEDIGAREIGEIPEQEPQYAPAEQGFLDEIAESNVNVADVEAQLIGTAHTICRGDTITRDAVAGQLIEQGRTDLDHQEVSTLLDDAAHANLC